MPTSRPPFFWPRPVRAATLAPWLLALAACGSSPPVQLYRLPSAPLGATATAPSAAASGVWLVSSVRLPDYLDRDALRFEMGLFFAATPEHKRIAALKAHHTLALAGRADEQPVNHGLRHAVAPRALANAEALGSRHATQSVDIDQGVVEHQIGVRNSRDRPHRPQLGIAGTRADERHARGGRLLSHSRAVRFR